MTGTLILLNDVLTEVDEVELIVGNSDPPASSSGHAQADIISTYVNEKVPDIDLIYSSDAVRIKKLVHKIRIGSKDQNLTSSQVRRLEGLQERGFGILNRTPVNLTSDLFFHTRIKPEKGESIFECRVRIMKCIDSIVSRNPNKKILLVSHPFVCQIAFNAILQRDHTLLTKFWQEKGSFVSFGFKLGTYGVQWSFINGDNAILNLSYTQEQIYSELLGRERSFPG